MLDSKEAAKLLNIKTPRMRGLLIQEKVKGQKIGYDWFIEQEEIERYRRDRRKTSDVKIAHDRRFDKIKELKDKNTSYKEIAEILNNLGFSYNYFGNEWDKESVKIFYNINKRG